MIFHYLASVCTIHSVWNPLLSCPFTWGFPPLHQESANEGWVPLSLASWSHSLQSCFTSCGLLSVSLIGQAFHEAKGHLLFLFILYRSFFTCFWCGLFLKSLLNLLQHCFCFMFWIFFFFFFLPWGRWKSLNTYLLGSDMWLPSLTLQPTLYPLSLVW